MPGTKAEARLFLLRFGKAPFPVAFGCKQREAGWGRSKTNRECAGRVWMRERSKEGQMKARDGHESHWHAAPGESPQGKGI